MLRTILSLIFSAVLCFADTSQEVQDRVFVGLELQEDFLFPQKCLPTQKDTAFVSSVLKARGALFDSIEEIFEQNDVPKVLAYIAIAESKLRDITDRGGVVGVWQLKPQESRMHGLKVSKKLDERHDPIKSTVTMARHLTYLYKKFGRWDLAVLGYNSGEGRLAKAIKKAGSDDIGALLDPKKRYLSKTARRVFYRYITLAMTGEQLRENDEIQEDEEG